MSSSFFTACRSLGHAWAVIDDDHLYPDMTERYPNLVVVRCTRCRSRRYDGVLDTGAVEKRRYRYTIGYKYPRHQAPTRDQQRLILLQERDSR